MTENKETMPLIKEQNTTLTPQQEHMLQLILNEQLELQKQYRLRKKEQESQKNIQESQDKSNKKHTQQDLCCIYIVIAIVMIVILLVLGIYAAIKLKYY